MNHKPTMEAGGLQKYKIFTEKSEIAGDDGFKLFIEKRDTLYYDEGKKYITVTKYTDSGENGVEIFFTSDKQSADKSDAKSTASQQSSNKTETVLWEKSCLPERHYLFRIINAKGIEEPVVAKLMEYVIIFDRPCLFRLADLIKQYRLWKEMYPNYLIFKRRALGPYVDPPHPYSESYRHFDGPSCECRLCVANRKIVDILEGEGVTLDNLLDSAIDCVKNRMSNIIISQIRMSFLQTSNIYLELTDGFEAIIPPLIVLRLEKFFKELYEIGITFSWEILKKLSLIVSYEMNYNAAFHFITYLFETAAKLVTVAEKLELKFICFDWRLINDGMYLKVFLLHFYQKFVFQRQEIIDAWSLCYDIIRNHRESNSNHPGEISTEEIKEKYDTLVIQMKVVDDLWKAKTLPFAFEEREFSMENVLKISYLFPLYRPLEENVKMTCSALWNPETKAYELGPQILSEKVVDVDPILEVCLTNPKNKDEKVCIQVLCKDKPIVVSPDVLTENRRWSLSEPLIQAVRKIFESAASGPLFSDIVSRRRSSCSSKSDGAPRKRQQSKREAEKEKTPRYAIYGRTPKQKLATKSIHSQKKRLRMESFKHYEKRTINDRVDFMTDKHSSNITDPKCHLSVIKHRDALQEILSSAIQMGAKAVSCMKTKVKHNHKNHKFFVVFQYSKCKIPEKEEPKVLVPLDQVMALVFGTLYKHSVLTEKEKKSIFFQQFQGNETNRARDPKAKNINWEGCNANVMLSAQKLTPVQNTKETAENSSIPIPTLNECEEFLDLIKNALERSFKKAERRNVKKRLLEAFHTILYFMDPTPELFNEPKNTIFVKGCNTFRPIRVFTNRPPKIALETVAKKSHSNILPPLLAAEISKSAVQAAVPQSTGASKRLEEIPSDELLERNYKTCEVKHGTLKDSNQIQTESILEKTFKAFEMRHVSQKYLGRVDTHTQVAATLATIKFGPEGGSSRSKNIDRGSRKSSIGDDVLRLTDGTEDEEADFDNSCKTPGCNADHNNEIRFEHVHGCAGGPHADPNCDCYKSRSAASMLLTEDYHRCASQMCGLSVNLKYSQMRQKLLKTLNQRRDTGEDVHETTGATLMPKPCQNTISKAVGKKETIVVTKGCPPTEDVDALVSMIEGTKLSSDPKKAAKRARQKEKKMQLQKEEDERRIKMEEEQRVLEELRQQELLRQRLAEELKLAKELRDSNSSKSKSKKKKKKNKNGEKTTHAAKEGESNASVINSAPALPINDPNNKLTKMERVAANARELSEQSAKSANEKLVENEKTEKKNEIVTIRRHPTVPDTTVTISKKSDNGQENLLYTLINGQVYETDPENKPKDEDNTKSKTAKKKKRKGKNNETPTVNSNSVSVHSVEESNCKNYLSTEFVKTPNISIDNKTTITCDNTNKNFNFLNSLTPESEIDLSKLKLPPGITITKVNQHINPNRGFVAAIPENTKEVTITKAGGSQFANGSPTSFYHPEIFKKPNVIVVDSQYNSANADFTDDFVCRKEADKFKEVVSNKTKRLRNRAQRSRDGDDLDEDYSEMESGGSYAQTPDASYYTRNYSTWSKKPATKSKTVPLPNPVQSSQPNEVKPKGPVFTTSSVGRSMVHPAKVFRNHNLGQNTDTGEEGLHSRLRHSNGAYNNYNIIPRYAKSRQRMNGHENDCNSIGISSPPKTTLTNCNIKPESVPNVPNTTLRDNSFLNSDNPYFATTNVMAQVFEEANSATKGDGRWNAPAAENERFTPDVPQVFNTWESLLKDTFRSPLGPFTVQAGDRKSWSPWGELSATEASSPDLSSRPQSCELLTTEGNGENGAFNLAMNQKCVSPVQRPTPIPIGTPPLRDVNIVTSLPQQFKRQCLVNPIARPSSKNSRPDSMLSNRSSVEDLSVGLGRMVQSNGNSFSVPPSVSHMPTANTPFGVRDLLTSTYRHDVFGDSSFTPGFRDTGVSMADSHRPSTSGGLYGGNQQQNLDEQILQFGGINNSAPNNTTGTSSFMPTNYPQQPVCDFHRTSQWNSQLENNFPTSVGSARPMYLHNNYDTKMANTNFGQGNGESVYGRFNSTPGANSMEMRGLESALQYDEFSPGGKSNFGNGGSPYFLNSPHAAIGAERTYNPHFGGQRYYQTSFEHP